MTPCEYCKQDLDDDTIVCPNCGAWAAIEDGEVVWHKGSDPRPHVGWPRWWPWVAAAVVLVSAGSFLLLTKESDSADNARACAAAERWVVALGDIDKTDYDSLTAGLAEANKAEAEIAENAPRRVAEAIATMDRLDPDSIRLSEQNEYRQAQAIANEWVREECDLDMGF